MVVRSPYPAVRSTLLALSLACATAALAQAPEPRPAPAAAWQRLATSDPQLQKERWGDLATAAGRSWMYTALLAELGTSWREIEWIVPGAALRYRRGLCVAQNCQATEYVAQYDEAGRQIEFLEDGKVTATGRVQSDGSVRISGTSLLGLLTAETLRFDAASAVFYSDAHDMRPVSATQLAQATKGFAGQGGTGATTITAATTSPAATSSPAATNSPAAATTARTGTTEAAARPRPAAGPVASAAPAPASASQSETELRAELASMRARMEALSRQLEEKAPATGAQGPSTGAATPVTTVAPVAGTQVVAQGPSAAPAPGSAALPAAGTPAPAPALSRAEQLKAEREAKAHAAEEAKQAAAEKARAEAAQRAEAKARQKEEAQARADEAKRLAQEKREREEQARRDAAEARKRDAEDARRLADEKRQQQAQAQRAAEEARIHAAEQKGTNIQKPAGGKLQFASLAIDKGKGFIFGWSASHPTREAADDRALQECSKAASDRGVSADCRLVLKFSGSACGVYKTVASKGTAFGWGVAPDRSTADATATRELMKRAKGGDAAAPAFVWACNAPNSGPFTKLFEDRTREYATTTIGRQVWMAENLDLDQFRNGDPVPLAGSKDEFFATSKAGKPVYFNTVEIAGAGNSYNLAALTDPRGLCPAGFRPPTADDWRTLLNTLGGGRAASSRLQKEGAWPFPGDNSSGFSALPAGYEVHRSSVGEQSEWWSTTIVDNGEYSLMFQMRKECSSGRCWTQSGLTHRWPKDGSYLRCIKE